MMRYGWGVGMFGGWLASALMGLLMVVLFVFLIVALVRLLRHAGRHEQFGGQPGPARPVSEESNALRILDERFAKGEIDEEEYTRKKELLKKQP